MPDNKQSPRCPYCGAEMKKEMANTPWEEKA